MKTKEKPGNIAPEHPLDPSAAKADAIIRLEEERNADFICHEALKKQLPDLAEWLKKISRYGNVDSVTQIFRSRRDSSFSVLLFTNDHQFTLSAYAPNENNTRGYLGCIATNRKARVGETWFRGCDLGDGDYSLETFEKILGDMISLELKSIQFFKGAGDKLNKEVMSTFWHGRRNGPMKA